jgi:hypothetical protein
LVAWAVPFVRPVTARAQLSAAQAFGKLVARGKSGVVAEVVMVERVVVAKTAGMAARRR